MQDISKWIENLPRRYWITFHIAAAVLLFGAFAFKMVPYFDSPLVGYADTENWEYTGYYLWRHIEWNPLPTLPFENDEAFYPYGVSQVFLMWSPERDLLYALCREIFGHGPWLALYFLFSRALIGIGSFLILRRDFGWKRGLFASYLLVFFDFYTLHKWPGHASQAYLHWVVLAIIVDFIIVRRFHLHKTIAFKHLAFRFFLTVSSIGLDLGYVAGYGLLSLAIMLVWLTVGASMRWIRSTSRSNLVKQWKASFQKSFSMMALCGALSLLPAFLYVPLAYDVADAALGIDWGGFEFLTWYSHPLRLFVPMLERFHPTSVLDSFFADRPEGLGSGSPGLFLLILALIGIWHTRRRILLVVPLLIYFAFFLFHNPDHFPIINIFPWSRYVRTAPRFTVMYASILILLSMEIDWKSLWSTRMRRVVTILLLLLGLIELRASYRMHSNQYAFRPDAGFYNYMGQLKSLPGEAVLDWPFCAWDAGYQDELCPYSHRISGIYGFRRFHEKKVVGQFFGRLHPDDLAPFKQAGWDQMFHPGDAPLPLRETRCFNEQEWRFFDAFFRRCDFAAINLYPALLPDECRTEFVSRYGEPTATTEIPLEIAGIPIVGSIELYPADAEDRAATDVEACRNLRLEDF